MDEGEHSTKVCPCSSPAPNHAYHTKCRPSLRQSCHTSPWKSPTSLFPWSTLGTSIATSSCAIAPLSAVTGWLPAAIISLQMSGSSPVHNITYSSQTSFDPQLCPPGFYLLVKSPCIPQHPTGDQQMASVWTSRQDSLCTNSGVNCPTWKNSGCSI